MHEPEEPANPYSSAYDDFRPREAVRGPIAVVPTKVDAGDILNHAWETFKIHWGPLFGAFMIITIIGYVIGFANSMIQLFLFDLPNMQQGPGAAPNPFAQQGFHPVGLLMSFAGNILQQFFYLGFARMNLDAARGETPRIEQIFGAGRWFLPFLGWYILFTIGIVFGFVLLIVPGIILALMWWPGQYLIIDDQCGPMEAFSKAREITSGNKGTTFVLWMAAFGITILGILALCVGVFVAAPFISLIFATAYAMMSGQIGYSAQETAPVEDYGFGTEFQ